METVKKNLKPTKVVEPTKSQVERTVKKDECAKRPKKPMEVEGGKK
jgi:hypothetical protein